MDAGINPMKISILLVDDRDRDRDWMRSIIWEVVDKESCEISEAPDYETAVELIATKLFDLILLDLVLHDPAGDRQTWEGFWLLEDLLSMGALPLTKVIVTSQFAETEDAIRLFRDFGAEDVWVKSDKTKLEDGIRSILSTSRGFGLRCTVTTEGWEISDALDEIVGQRHFARLSSPVTKSDAARELTHLLHRLFADCDSVVAKKMSGGASGAGVLRCERTQRGARMSDVVAKFGLREQVIDEASRASALQELMTGMRSTRIEGVAVGRYVGISRYSFLGLELGRAEPLDVVLTRRSIDEACATLDNLFGETCRLFYQPGHGRPVDSKLISHYLSMVGASAEQVVRAYEFKYGRTESPTSQVSLMGASRLLPHPVSGLAVLANSLRTATVDLPTHGDLHPGNVFVDSISNSCWLIDFGRSGYGHWARDFVELELAIRLQAMDPPEDSELFAVESAFDSLVDLASPIALAGVGGDSTLRLATAVSTIRRHAAIAGAANLASPERAAQEYVVALYGMGLNYFRLHKLIRSARRKKQVQMTMALLREQVDSIQRLL